MRTGLIIFSLLFFFAANTASAHRLNEYLQATTISIVKDSVRMHLRLTAGTDIAPRIIKLIDTNSDGIFSAAEQKAYIKLVLHSERLFIDEQQVSLQQSAWSFPSATDMKNGTGEIELFVAGPIPQSTSGHHLVLVNEHEKHVAVYLVNCLLPEDNRIQVKEQTRNTDQSVYTLDFSSAPLEQKLILKKAQFEKGDRMALIKTYFVHGVRHILLGFDHLLFLCALVLGAASLWELVKIVTAFTIAHSLTITLAGFHLIHLPESLVEIMISASIFFVAVQNIWWPKSAKGGNRLIVAFIFGLFHGLGFAGGLLTIMQHFDPNTVLLAIFGFTIGIEAGNQLVLLPLYGLLWGIKKNKIARSTSQYTFMIRIASAIVAAAGMYYLVIAVYGAL
jgi:hydrogenase/urease accessory protein HupE